MIPVLLGREGPDPSQPRRKGRIMLTETALAPLDTSITLEQLDLDPYPIFRRLRAQSPVLRIKALNRTLLTKAADTRHVKDNPELFSSDDPNTPMERAFQAKTLMRKDGAEHLRERNAMAPAFAPRVIKTRWMPDYQAIAEAYVARLPRGEVVDLFPALAAPFAARGLAHLLGLEKVASDAEMERWSQTLIDGAGNFGGKPELFDLCDTANEEMNLAIGEMAKRYRTEPNESALSAMVNAADPIPYSQIVANIKIAIGGGINEPRDALCTIIYGLLTNPEQRDYVVANEKWGDAFEEGVRWVAPIQASSRRVTADTEIHGCFIPKGDVVMTSQASASRDEDVFADGENYNIFDNKGQHQAFGNGPHFCQGAHVARRVVGAIMLPLLFDRFPNMSIPDPGSVQWRGFGFRGPINMPVLLA
jgi:cytochrome P450